MKILVTGGAGFIGSHLCRALLKRGDAVVALDNFHPYYDPQQKRNNVKDLLEDPNFTLAEDDFCDRARVFEIFKQHSPERVAHLGAMANVRYSVKHPQEFVQTNVVGTSHLLDAAVESGTKSFVYASTSSVYGETDKIPFVEGDSTDYPLAPYPATKKAGELLGHSYFNMYNLPFTALRFFNVYGPCGRPDMMPFKVFDMILKQEEITLFDAGNMKRDWTYVDDIVSGVMLALDKPLEFEVFNLGRGEPVLMSEFMQIAQEISGKEAIIKNTPRPASDPVVTFASIDKARELLGYNPDTSLREGLGKVWEWFNNR